MSRLWLDKHSRLAKPLPGTASINWEHPISRGLLRCYLFNTGAGYPTSLVPCNETWTLGGTSGLLWGNGYDGPALKFDGANRMTTGNTILGVSSQMTAMICATPSAVGVYQYWIAKNAYNHPFTLHHTNANVPRFRVYTASTYTAAGTGIDAVAGARVVLCGTYDGANAKLYKDGRFNVQVAATGTLLDDAAGIEFGGYSTYYATGLIHYAYIWNRALSAEEVLELYSNPYVFLRDIKRATRIILAAPPAGLSKPIAMKYYRSRRMA